jgi:CTP:molybdopterin cytidylyltransferase MocA
MAGAMRRIPPPRLEDLPAPPPGRAGWPWDVASPPAPGGGPWPAIAVVTPSFQQARFLEATIRSVLLQGYPELAYVVVDGGSTDGSVEILRRYERWLSSWTSEPDRGQSHAINKGLAAVDAEIAGWLNSDDRLLPGALHAVARAAREDPAAVAWIGATRAVDAEGKVVYPRVAPRQLRRDALADWGHAGHVPQPSCFFSRGAAARVGLLDERYHYTMDVDLWLRLAAVGRLAEVDGLWAEETLHADAKTTASRGRMQAELHLLQLRSGYEDLALRRLGEELQELELHRRGSPAARLKHEASLLLHPLAALVRRAFPARRRTRAGP